MPILVPDAGPLITLAYTDRLDLLQQAGLAGTCSGHAILHKPLHEQSSVQSNSLSQWLNVLLEVAKRLPVNLSPELPSGAMM